MEPGTINDTPNLSPEIALEILNHENELLEKWNIKDTEIREQEREIEDKVNKKDSEKREFNMKLVSGAALALITVVGLSTAVLGGNFDLKLPKK